MSTEHGLPCVHCGLCLDTCPTYRLFGTEADSPRGRIYLMEAIEQGDLELDSRAVAHLDGCLGCVACETACPSGVSFGERIEAFRPRVRARALSPWRRWTSRLAASTAALSAGMVAARAIDALGLEAARRKVPALGLLPARTRGRNQPVPTEVALARHPTIPPPSRPRARVALLDGCVATVLRPSVTAAAVDALHRNDIAVVGVPDQVCCGALDLHAGNQDRGLELARRNVAAFGNAAVDYVVTTAAGCGAVLRDYGRLLTSDATAGGPAAELAGKSRDVCELLDELGFAKPSHPCTSRGTVAYHDACHLVHAARVTRGPRAILEAATGAIATDLGENELCCGSAGSYNLDHHRVGMQLGRRKAELAMARGAGIVAAGNVGCLMQLERALSLAGYEADVRHPIELLAQAYREEAYERSG